MILTVVDTHGATAQTTASVTVINPGFRLAASLASVNANAGASATQHIRFTPSPGIAATMTLVCLNLPARSTCSFSPASLAAGSAQTDVLLTINTTANTAALAHPRILYAAWLPFTGLGFLGMAVVAVPSRRRKAAAITLALLCISAVAIGCGGSYNGTPKGNYTVTVSGTSGNLTKTTSFSLTVN